MECMLPLVASRPEGGSGEHATCCRPPISLRTADLDRRAFPQHSSDDKLFDVPTNSVHRAYQCKQHSRESSRSTL